MGLEITVWGQASALADTLNVTFNGDTTSSHYGLAGYFQQNTSAPAANAAFSAGHCSMGHLTAKTSESIMTIPFYADTSFQKSASYKNADFASASTGTNDYDIAGGCIWDNATTPAAITSVTVTISSGNYVAGTKFIVRTLD